MSINPLQPPVNYMAMTPQVNLGQQFAEFGQVLAQRQQRQQAQEVKQQFATDLQTAQADGTQQAWLGMIAKYPQFREAFGDVRKGVGEERLKNEFTQGFEISNAMEMKDFPVAIERTKLLIEAKKNSGEPTKIYEDVLGALERGDFAAAQSGANLSLAVLDPDRYEKSVKARKSPEVQAASLKEAEAKALSAGVAAEFARPVAMAELAKTRAETLAPSVRESIDFANLQPDQQKIFQALQILKKPPAAVTNVNVSNVDKTAAAELGKLVPDLYNQANSAASQLTELPRYQAALDAAITGPFAEQRLSTARVASALGFTGDKAVNATREVIQGLSEMALKSRTMLTGQGQITEGEQKLLIKARSGDIDFTKGELKTIFGVADRAAKAQYNQSRKLLESAAKESPTARMFLENMQPLAQPEAPKPAAPTAPAAPAATAVPGMPAGFRVIR
jgi:hypothetical protein